MESLHLPQDLYWDGKVEPSSPPSSDLYSLDSNEVSWIFEDSFAKNILLNHNQESDVESFFQDDFVAGIEGELLMELEFDIKTESWVDGKTDVSPTLLDYGILQPEPLVTAQLVKLQNSYDIIMELDKIYHVNELQQLTPPQTPPQNITTLSKEIFNFSQSEQPYTTLPTDLAPIPSDVSAKSPCSKDLSSSSGSPFYSVENFIPNMLPTNQAISYTPEENQKLSTISTDIAREMQIVDEIIQDRVKDLPDFNDDDSMYSVVSSSLQSHSTDDDWTPVSSSSSITSKRKNFQRVTKKTGRQHGRGVVDKKIRKKEQNKNAATRYRQKKKHEMEEVLEEERILTNKNEELLKSVTEVEREMKYLKQLMREFFKSKGLLK